MNPTMAVVSRHMISHPAGEACHSLTCQCGLVSIQSIQFDPDHLRDNIHERYFKILLMPDNLLTKSFSGLFFRARYVHCQLNNTMDVKVKVKVNRLRESNAKNNT
jgi:hypothetical protein